MLTYFHPALPSSRRALHKRGFVDFQSQILLYFCSTSVATKKKRFSVEQIVGVLKQAQVGVPVAEVIRKAGIMTRRRIGDGGYLRAEMRSNWR